MNFWIPMFLSTKNGGIAICAPIAPYAATRKLVREMTGEHAGNRCHEDQNRELGTHRGIPRSLPDWRSHRTPEIVAGVTSGAAAASVQTSRTKRPVAEIAAVGLPAIVVPLPGAIADRA